MIGDDRATMKDSDRYKKLKRMIDSGAFEVLGRHQYDGGLDIELNSDIAESIPSDHLDRTIDTFEHEAND